MEDPRIRCFVACHYLEEAHIALRHAFQIPLGGLPSPLYIEMRRRIRLACTLLEANGVQRSTTDLCRSAQDAFASHKMVANPGEYDSTIFDAAHFSSRKLDVAMQQIRDRLGPAELVAYYAGWAFARLRFYAQLARRGPAIFHRPDSTGDAWRDIALQMIDVTAKTIETNVPRPCADALRPENRSTLGVDLLYDYVGELGATPGEEALERLHNELHEVLVAIDVDPLGDWILEELEYRSGVRQLKKPEPEAFTRSQAILSEVAKLEDAEFGCTREPTTLERMISILDAALHEFRRSPLRVTFLDQLAGRLWERTQVTGSREDLDRAVVLVREALRRFPPMASLEGVLNNLGLALSTRFEYNDDREDLVSALDAFEEATTGQQAPSGRELIWWNNLANALRLRFHFLTQDVADLDEAIRRMKIVVEGTPVASPDEGIHKQNLANMLRERLMFVVDSKETGLLNEAITLLEDALAAQWTPVLDRPGALASLAAAYAQRHERFQLEEDLEASTEQYRACVREGERSRANIALKASVQWGELAFARRDWKQSAEAFDAAMRISRDVLEMQIGRSHRESTLMWSQGIAADTAYALAQLGDFPAAVIALEAGIARMLSHQLETSRHDLKALDKLGHEHVLKRYRAAAAELDQQWARLDRPRMGVRGVQEVSWNELVQLRKELKQAVVEIRRVPGFERFLLDLDLKEIMSAATDPIVYVVATMHGGAALVVEKGDVRLVDLPELDRTMERTLVQRHLAAVDRFLRSRRSQGDFLAWERSLQQVLDELGRIMVQPIACEASADRVAWIPIGALKLLPIHAAPIADSPKECLLDRTYPYYAPNARSLLHRDSYHPAKEGLLLIKVADAEGQPPLPNSNLERDLMRRCLEQVVILEEEKASRIAVLEALGKEDITHFSCHGAAQLHRPLESSLLLRKDERVTVEDLLSLGRSAGSLISLSACETGVVGLDLPEEVVGMPTALIGGGTRSVLSTLWVVGDKAAAYFFGRFYSLWLRKGAPPLDAFIAAQRWLRQASVVELLEFLDELGPWKPGSFGALEVERMKGLPQDRILFATPVAWGPFHWTGLPDG